MWNITLPKKSYLYDKITALDYDDEKRLPNVKIEWLTKKKIASSLKM